MTWFKVDDQFHSHPKVAATTLAARGLWVTAGTWSSAHLTDGVVPDHVLALLGGTPELAAELVTAGLWRRTRGAHRFHDWTAFQPSSEQVRTLRAQRAEAGRKGGQVSASKRQAKGQANQHGQRHGDPATSGNSQANSQASASALLDESLNPRPDPTPLLPEEGGSGDAPALTRGRSAPPADTLAAVRQQLRQAATNHRTRTRPGTDPPPESEPA